MKIELPDEKRLTVGWLIEHLPLRWWAVIGAFVLGTFSAGYAVGFFFTADIGAASAQDVIRLQDEKSQLRKDVQELQKEKVSLSAEIAALKVEKRISSMTPEERRDALKEKWTRD